MEEVDYYNLIKGFWMWQKALYKQKYRKQS